MQSPQPELFQDNYSYDTSLPAYHSNKEEKQRHKERIYNEIVCGADCIKKIFERINKGLTPQSRMYQTEASISGRISDLKKEGRVYHADKENHLFYKGKLRKKILVVKNQ